MTERTIPQRLSKYIHDRSAYAHRQIRRLHHEGAIRVAADGGDARAPESLGEYVFAEDVVYLNGEPLPPKHPPEVYAIVHKPAGVISTTSDPQGRPTLQPWLEQLGERVFPVGRLDRETTGLLLLTDDGDLSYMLLKPQFHVPKEYILRVRGHVEARDARLAQLVEGIDLEDGKHDAAALDARITAMGAAWTQVRVALDEGRYRQVRKMCRRADLNLQHLHRARLGPIRLMGLDAGAMRHLDDEEVDALWAASGGRHLPRQRAVAALRRHAARWREEGRPHTRLEAWLAAEPSVDT